MPARTDALRYVTRFCPDMDTSGGRGVGCTDLLLGIFRLKNGARMGQGEDMLERKKEKKGIRYEG